jgi:hypothetical protein
MPVGFLSLVIQFCGKSSYAVRRTTMQREPRLSVLKMKARQSPTGLLVSV